MKQPNRILIVEDKAVDADLAKHTIQKVLKDCEFQVVETSEDFLTALQIFQPELILSDYSLPRFDGMKALRLALNHAPLTPLIIWTGSISEDVAVECMKAGANNYVLKDNLKRLAPAVIHALEERQLLLERKQAEEIIQNSEQRFRALIENGLDNISLLRADGALIWESPSATSMLGYAPNEFVGHDIFSLMHPDDLDWTRDLYTKLIQEPGGHRRGTFRLLRSDGAWHWVDAIATNMLNEPGVNAIVINYRDVTERKQVEEALQASEKRFRALIENGLDSISLLRANGTLIWESPSAIRLLDYAPDEYIGQNIFMLIHPDDLKWTQEMYTQLVHEPGSHGRGKFRLRHADGTWRWVEAIVTNMLSEPGVNAIVVNYRDITERKQAEDVRREEQNLLRTLIDNIPDRIYAMDRQGRKTLSNAADWKASGAQTMEDVIGKTDFDIYRPELAEPFWQIDQTVLDSGQPIINFEEPGLDFEGNLVSILTTKIPLRDEAGNVTGLVGVGRDITDRQKAEENLRHSENRYRLVTRATNDVIWEWNPKLHQLLWSENAWHVFGYSPEEIGPEEKWWDDHIHPDDREHVIAKLNALIAGSESIWMEEYRFLLKNGSYAYISDRAYIERDENGMPLRMIGAMSDISSRKASEVERQALFEIMQGIANTTNLQELLALIHRSIATVIYARNFFVVLYNEQDGLFEEIYSIDQYDPPAPPTKLEKSITSYVFRTGQPLLILQAGFDQLVEQGEVELVGTHSASWLGVPLKTYSKTIGVIAVQDYENPNRYTEHDKEFLASIASQVALAIERKQSETALFESITQFRTLFEASPDAILLLDPRDNWPILDCNTAACEMNGYTRSELIGQSIDILNPTPGTPSERAAYLERIQAVGVLRMEAAHRRKDGTVLPIEVSTSLIALGGRDVILGIDRDISERRRAEDALHKSEALYRQAIEITGAVPYYEFYYDEGRLIKYDFIGEGIRQITGYGPEEFNAKIWDSLVDEVVLVEDLAGYSLEDGIQRVRAGENSIWKCEHRLRDRDGKIHWVFEAAVELRDENGVSHGSIGTYQDITARKLAVEAEHEQRALAEALRDTAETLSSSLSYEEVLDHILAAVGRVVPHDAATIMLIAGESAHVVRSYGYDNRGFDTEIMGIELRLAETHNLREMIETRQPVIVSDTHSYPGWQRLEATDWLRSNVGAPISIQDQVIGFILLDGQTRGFFTPVHAERLEAFANQAAIAIHNAHLLQQAQDEIAERIQAEKALRNSESKYRALAENSLQGIAIYQGQKIVYANPAMCQMNGYTAKELIDMTADQIIALTHPDDRAVAQERAVKRMADETISPGFEGRILRKDGTIAWVQSFSNPIEYDGKPALLSTMIDITERKQAEEELRASEERFRQLADNIQEAFWMTDAESGKEIYLSPAAETIWERPIESLMYEPIAFINSVFPADQPAVLEAIEKEKRGEKVEIEYRIIWPDGTLRWVWDRAFPIFDETGKVKRIAGISTDITERRTAEQQLRKLSRAVEQTGSTIVITDTDGTIEYVNPKFTEITGYSLEEVLGQNPRILKSGFTAHEVYKQLWETVIAGKEWHGELLNKKKNDELFWENVTISPIQNEHGEITHFVGVKEDITQRKRAEEEIRRRAEETSALLRTSLALTNLDLEVTLQTLGNSAKTLFAADGCRIFLMEPDSQSLRCVMALQENFMVFSNLRVKVGEGVTGAVAASGRAEIVNEMQNDPRSVQVPGTEENEPEAIMFAPLKERDHTIGVLSIRRSRAEQLFQPADLELLEAFASMAASAVSNARLFEETQRRLTELEALYENGLAVGRLLTANEIGNRMINTFADYLRWHHVTIRLKREESDDLDLVAFNMPGLKDEERTATEQKFVALINKVGQGFSGWVI